MKLTFKCALSLVLGMSLAGSALAQDSFPDVADSHWASDAIKRLKLEKFINGYPDGTFAGARNVTRYEMASMLYMIYNKGICFNEEIDAKIKALDAKINSMSGGTPATDEGSAELIKSIRSDLAMVRAWKSDIDTLKRMSTSYSKELNSLGVDVAKMRKDLDEMRQRMDKVKAPSTSGISITGDANFFVSAGTKENGFATGLNQDGRYAQGNGNGAGLDTLGVLHELGLRIASGSDASVPFVANLVAGNMLSNGSSGFGNQSQFEELVGTSYATGNTALYLHRAVAHTKLGTVGRQGVALSPFIFRRSDNTSFFSNERYDDGKFMIDGVSFGIGGNTHDAAGDRTVGGNSGMVFIGTIGNMRTTDGGSIQPLGTPPPDEALPLDLQNGTSSQSNRLSDRGIERIMGFTYNFGSNGNGLTFSYVNFDGSGGDFNRVEVYGADFSTSLGNTPLGDTRLFAGFGASNAKLNGTVINDNDNQRLNIGVGAGKFYAAYQRIQANYLAPGDWGRVGLLRNLTDTQGFTVGTQDGSLTSIGGFGIGGSYSSGEGINSTGDYKSTNINVTKQLTPKWMAKFAYEMTDFNGGFQDLPGTAFAKFRTLSLGYDAGSARMVNVYYQLGDTNGVAFNPNIGTAQRGGFFGMQYSVKF